ncbi:hypothetical protein GCM10009039_27760 [Halocalculus aciditolerans]|uniref:Uncharacterized protein n=1 Tax=Halocalculus aciditolerans TaxID=1383812 RepID=A0A830FMS6_9EURY|nr:hypothetical protein GCM10009039_27760 [Halocalculus aciditolerans]
MRIEETTTEGSPPTQSLLARFLLVSIHGIHSDGREPGEITERVRDERDAERERED